MQDFSDALINEYDDYEYAPIDQEALTKYNDALKQGYLDLDAWKKAYWKRVQAAGLDSLFTKNGAGMLRPGTWETIVTCSDEELATALKRLYRAYYYKGFRTKEGNERRELRLKNEIQAYKDKVRKQAEWQKDNMEDFIRGATAFVRRNIRNKYPNITNKFEEITGLKIEDCVAVHGLIPTSVDEVVEHDAIANAVSTTVFGYDNFGDGCAGFTYADKSKYPEDPEILYNAAGTVRLFIRAYEKAVAQNPNIKYTDIKGYPPHDHDYKYFTDFSC